MLTEERKTELWQAVHSRLPEGTQFCLLLHERGSKEGQVVANVGGAALARFVTDSVAGTLAVVLADPEAA